MNKQIVNEDYFYSLISKSKNIAFNRHYSYAEIHDWCNSTIENVSVEFLEDLSKIIWKVFFPDQNIEDYKTDEYLSTTKELIFECKKETFVYYFVPFYPKGFSCQVRVV